MENRFNRGIFITTSDFTPAGDGWVKETDPPITLVRGTDLVTDMIELGLGVKTVPVVRHDVDDDFFSSLQS